MVTKKATNVSYINDQSDPRVAQRVRSKRQDEWNSTYIITEAAPNELKLGRDAHSDEAGHRQGGGVGGCSSGVACENHLVGPEFSEGMQTHAHIALRISAGEIIYCR